VWLGDQAKKFKRVYHPPDNPLNALISFLNSLLYTACVSELYRTALYPGISYLHTPQTRRFSLALDLVEPFKPLMADRLLFRLLDCRMIGDHDFRKYSNGFLLTDDARRRVLQEWDQELRKTVHNPALNRSVSYRQLLRLDCYKLVNFLLEGREYRPYKIEY
jgi:CRISPR-associated protein Cas1